MGFLPFQRMRPREPTHPGLPHPVRCEAAANRRDAVLLPLPFRPESMALVGFPFGAFPFRRARAPSQAPLPACRQLGRGETEAPRAPSHRLPGFPPSGSPLPPPASRGRRSSSLLPWAFFSSRGDSSLLATNRPARRPAIFLSWTSCTPTRRRATRSSRVLIGEESRRAPEGRGTPYEVSARGTSPPKRRCRRQARVVSNPRRGSYPKSRQAVNLFFTNELRVGSTQSRASG
jgi:hypothetical protein